MSFLRRPVEGGKRWQRDPGRAVWLAEQINKHNWRIGVELGVLQGEMSFHLLENCPGLHLVCVDTWDGEGIAMSKPHPMALYFAAFSQEVFAKYADRCLIMKCTTDEAAVWFPEHFFDFVFLDADHSFDGAYQDIMNWRDLVKPSGMLCGHDLQPRHPGVEKALEAARINYGEGPDKIWFQIF